MSPRTVNPKIGFWHVLFTSKSGSANLFENRCNLSWYSNTKSVTLGSFSYFWNIIAVGLANVLCRWDKLIYLSKCHNFWIRKFNILWQLGLCIAHNLVGLVIKLNFFQIFILYAAQNVIILWNNWISCFKTLKFESQESIKFKLWKFKFWCAVCTVSQTAKIVPVSEINILISHIHRDMHSNTTVLHGYNTAMHSNAAW